MENLDVLDGLSLEHHHIETNGVRLHVVQAGPQDGELVVMLHGFPDFWYGWRHQIPYLARAGYRVYAPDQRGYNLSDKPQSLDAYSLNESAKDVISLIDASGRDKAYLVGHDWGGEAAWWTAMHYPDRLYKLAILNVPHPSVAYKNVRTNRVQLLRSWYIFFFQIPRLPEFLLTVGNARNTVRALLRSSNPGSFTDADLAHYVRAWKQPGAMTGMLNWYRSIVQRPPRPAEDSRVHVPTLIIWGKNDVALVPEGAEQSLKYCDDGRLVMLENATHWVQDDEPDKVNELLVEFFHSEPELT
jgi:pimeloyl-ACP methyl ester carboxylesterase